MGLVAKAKGWGEIGWQAMSWQDEKEQRDGASWAQKSLERQVWGFMSQETACYGLFLLC